MAIDVTCECGREFGVTNDSVGQSVKCPECGSWVRVDRAIKTATHIAKIADESVRAEKEFDGELPIVRDLTTLRDCEKTIEVICQCGKRLSVGEQFEGRQQCPNCRKWLTLRRHDPQRDAAVASLRLTKVPLGISCVFFGFLLNTFVNLVVDLGLPWYFQNARFFGWGLWIGWLLAGLLAGIGCLLCLTVPSQMPGKRYALLAALFNLIALAWNMIPFGWRLTVLPAWMTTGTNLLELTGSLWLMLHVQIIVGWFTLLPLVGAICFILFLKHLGHFLRERDLAARAAGLLKFGAWAVVLWFTVFGLLRLGVVPLLFWRVAGWLFGYLPLIALVIGIVRYALLLHFCRTALSNR